MSKKKTNIFSRGVSLVAHKRTAFIVSAVNAVLLTLATYVMNNMPLFTGENLDFYAGLDYLKTQVAGKDYVNDSVLLINVAYDKQLAEKKVDGLTAGNTDVTDRAALTRFLRNLRGVDYRYVFLDIRFDKDDITPHDSLLFATIAATPRIVVANHKDITLASPLLEPVAGYSDYMVTLTSTNFVRYQYLTSRGESMALKAYRGLCGDSLTRHGLLYRCNAGLSQNTNVIAPVLNIDETVDLPGDAPTRISQDAFVNLHKVNTPEDLRVRASGKYVIVGNMIDDQHDTVYGNVPGSILAFSAFWALKNGEHRVKPMVELVLMLMFFGISLSLFSREPILNKIAWVRNIKSKLIRFVLTFLGYSAVISVVTAVLYLCFGVATSIWLPALYFSAQKSYFNYKYMK